MEEHTNQNPKSRWQRWRENISSHYRMTIMNEDTFEEVRSFRLSLGNVYLALSTIVVLVAAIVVLLVTYTPLKYYLFGVERNVEREELIAMNRDLIALERDVEAMTHYANTFRDLLLGKYQSVLEAQQQMDSTDLQSMDNVEEVTLSEEEIQFRREMELEAIGQSARSGSRLPTSGSRDIPLEQMFMVAPLNGEIVGAFNTNKTHLGIDIISPKGTPVKSIMEGHVILSDFTYDTGYTIGIQHQNGVVSFYKHNSELLKTVGSFVKGGEAIAIIGNTGHQTTGPHLHFELWWRGIPVNPVDYIRF